MPELKCTVQTCVHNQQFLCNLDKIEVGGNKANALRGDLLRQLSGKKRRQLFQCDGDCFSDKHDRL